MCQWKTPSENLEVARWKIELYGGSASIFANAPKESRIVLARSLASSLDRSRGELECLFGTIQNSNGNMLAHGAKTLNASVLSILRSLLDSVDLIWHRAQQPDSS